MFANLGRDLGRLRHKSKGRSPAWALDAFLFDNGFQAVFFYRLARWFKRRRIPVFGPFFGRLGTFFTGTEISPSAEIGPGLRITHGLGLVVGGYARIGADATLLHAVTIGSLSEDRVDQMPAIGDRVFIGAGATLLGAITIGDDAFIGAGALVTRNILPGSRVLSRAGIDVAVPAATAGPDSGD